MTLLVSESTSGDRSLICSTIKAWAQDLELATQAEIMLLTNKNLQQDKLTTFTTLRQNLTELYCSLEEEHIIKVDTLLKDL